MEGAGPVEKALVPFPPGRFQTRLSVWPLSESPLCLFTAVTVTGSGVGGAHKKRKKQSKKGEKRSRSWILLLESARLLTPQGER